MIGCYTRKPTRDMVDFLSAFQPGNYGLFTRQLTREYDKKSSWKQAKYGKVSKAQICQGQDL
jgi:hypothetical protein